MPQLKQYLSDEGLRQWDALVKSARHIVLMGHISPDGDAVGSTLALAAYFTQLGKNATVILPNAYPDFLAWLPEANRIVVAERMPERSERLIREADLIVFMDFNDPSRLERYASLLEGSHARRILIDHHLNPSTDVDLMVSDPNAAATCEILFCLLHQLGAYPDMTLAMAQDIYCGLMTDTGAFAYNSNRPSLYLIVSMLLEKGVNKDVLYRHVYYNFSESRLRLEGYILYEKMRYFPVEAVSVFTLTREEMLRFHFRKGDAEGLVNIPLQIKGTKLSISLREDTEEHLVRVSLRSVGDFHCNEMAAEFFNGGGHANAAGGRLPDTDAEGAMQVAERAIEAYRDRLLAADIMK